MSQPAIAAVHGPRPESAANAHDPRLLVADNAPNILVQLMELAGQRGIPTRPWFAGLRLSPEQICDAHARVSYRQARTVIVRALQALPEPCLGLQLGRAETIGGFGLLGLAIMTSRTFGEALQIGVEHHRASGSLLDLGMAAVDAHSVAMEAWPRFGESELLPFLCEEAFSSSLAIARGLLGAHFTLKAMELTYPRPTHADEYAATFRCPVRFGASHNRAVVDTRWLAEPLPGHNPFTSRQALVLCRQQIDGDERHDEIVSAVERLLCGHLREHLRLHEVAGALNLSERSLRRRLAGSGQVFRDIQDRVRTTRALELLHEGTLSVSEVGYAIGFSDPREFRRAFKRWTGMPPQHLRQHLGNAGAAGASITGTGGKPAS